MNNFDKAKSLYQNKKVLILGLGLNQGGVGSTKFFAKLGSQVRVTDLKTKEELQPSLDHLKNFTDIQYTLGEHKEADIVWADLIIKNPALRPDNHFVQYAQKLRKQVEMDMGILLQFIKPDQIIGITGTKGKSTTASLIYEVVKINHRAIFAGNIGQSVLDSIFEIDQNTLLVLELSSFQLEAFGQHQISPKYSVITNIYPDHLNYYKSMADYIQAKKNIARYQISSDYLFLRQGDEVTTSKSFLGDLKSQIIYFSKDDLPENFSPLLPGDHNRENFAAALSLGKKFGLSEDQILKTLAFFKGVRYRLEMVKEDGGIKFYNDSASTNPESAIQALKSLPNSVVITGGENKNLDYQEMAKALDKYTKQVFFLEGSATKEIQQFSQKYNNYRTYANLRELVGDLLPTLKKADIVLFSPGAASFNMFKNEWDRGDQFNKLIGCDVSV